MREMRVIDVNRRGGGGGGGGGGVGGKNGKTKPDCGKTS